MRSRKKARNNSWRSVDTVLKPNSITLAGSELVRSQIPLRYLVRTSFEPALNQLRTSFEADSVMEFGREPVSSC